jgi:hypothetical protein
MAVLLDLITIGSLSISLIDEDPRGGAGFAAPIGALALIYNESSPVGQLYIKTGAGNTGWELTSTTASAGVVNGGSVRRLALYPATGNTLDDVLVQNSQNIDVIIEAQGSRSNAITYTIPNPGNTVPSASFVLTEGTQVINGNKTFGGNIQIDGDLDVNGTLTTIDAVNLQVSDKLITLNRGGAAASGGGSGFEVEENAVITAFIKQNSARTGWELLNSANSFSGVLLTSSLSASRNFTLPDATTTLVGRSVTPTANHVTYWTSANELNSEAQLNVSRGGTGVNGSSAANGQLLIGNGSGYTLATITGTANRVTVTNGAGSITLSTPQDIHTGASPTFTGLTLSSFATAGVVKNSAAGVLSTGTVALASSADVSGVLPIANGGTNSSATLNNNRIMISSGSAIVEHSAITAGSVYFGAATTGLPAQDASNFFWDDTNNRLGIGNNAPADTLHVTGNARVSGTGSQIRLLAESDMTINQATVATTDATATTLATVATTTDTTMLLEARVTGRRTGGSAGTAGDAACYVRTARINNIAGTVTVSNLQSDYTSEQNSSWNATFTVSGTNVLVRVNGAANNNVTWVATLIRTVV